MNDRLSVILSAYGPLREENRRLGGYSQREMSNALRCRVGDLFRRIRKNAGVKMPSSKTAIKLLGCTLDEFKVYMEGLFLPGMTWLNHGMWHVDHRRPCSSFFLEDVEQMKLCFHFSNLQPLWAADNLMKSDEWDGEWSVPRFGQPIKEPNPKKTRRPKQSKASHDPCTLPGRRPRKPPQPLPARPLSKRFLKQLAEVRALSQQYS